MGYKCNGCEKEDLWFDGFRYKCTICPDVSLCRECLDKGIHHEHNLEKVTILRGKVREILH